MPDPLTEIVLFVFSILACQGAGFLGSIFTAPAIPSWYSKLKKPSFAPPNRVFAPVWITLYALMGVSLYLVLREGLADPRVPPGLGAFAAQLALNVLWSYAFFGRRSPRAGLATIAVLWAAILWTIIAFLEVSAPAALLLVPYIAWTGVAAALNWAITRLN